MGSCSSRELSAIQLLVSVADAACSQVGGRISCIAENAVAPIRYEWYNDDGSAALLELSTDRSNARSVPAGRYKIVVTDARDTSVARRVEVSSFRGPTVVGYAVTHASSDTARDGKIVAQIENMDDSKIMWTSGVCTDEHSLCDVPPGTYTATPLSAVYMHACEAAVVLATRAPL